MRRFVLCSLALVASVSLALARDITTLTGQTYRAVTITRVEATGIGISHDDGVAFLDFSTLPPEIRREFGYTAEQQQRQIEAQAAAALLAAQRAQQATLAQQQSSIATRDYTATNYTTRDYGTTRYTGSGYTGGPVHVSGYTRKDGTYVHSYTRRR